MTVSCDRPVSRLPAVRPPAVKIPKGMMRQKIGLLCLMLSIMVNLALIPCLWASDDLPLAVGIVVNKANALMAAQKPEQALAVLTAFAGKQKGMDSGKATRKGYDHYYIHFLSGTCHTLLGQTANAADAFAQAAEKKPDLSAAWLNLARCRYELGQITEAAQAFATGYDTSEEKEPTPLYYAAACHALADQPDLALATFDKLLTAHKNEMRQEWKQTLVNVLFALEKYRQALPWIEDLAAETRGDEQAGWQEMLLFQYLSLDMKEKALSHARFLTRTCPTEPKWWKALTHVYLARNQPENGLASLLTYSYLSPLAPDETLLLADLYLSCNIPLSAARYYEAWFEQHSHTLSNRQTVQRAKHLARAWLAAGNPDRAMTWIEKGLAGQSDPDLLHIKDYVMATQKYLE